MSKGLTCDICRKTTTIADFDCTVLPEGFDGWLHIGVSKRLSADSLHPKLPIEKVKYHEIDICPKCAEKIRDEAHFENSRAPAWDLISEIFGE